jgi:hypothetical protein
LASVPNPVWISVTAVLASCAEPIASEANAEALMAPAEKAAEVMAPALSEPTLTENENAESVRDA